MPPLVFYFSPSPLFFRTIEEQHTMVSFLHLDLRPRLIHVLSCLVVLLLVSHCPNAVEEGKFTFCDRSVGNYTDNSPFKANLGRLLASLNSTTPATGYSNGTVGQGTPDAVHGLAMCLGDLMEDQCRDCLAIAVPGAEERCPHSKASTVWYPTCQVRYSSINFFGTPTLVEAWVSNKFNATNSTVFNSVLGGLLDRLIQQATNLPRMFAAGAERYSGLNTIYALVQCTRDLSSANCSWCLRDKMGFIPSCCSGEIGAKVMGGSCYLRYEIYPFFNTSAATEPLPAPTPSPSMAPISSPPTAHLAVKKNNARKTVVAIVTPATIVLAATAVVFLCICARRRAKRIRMKGWQSIMQPTECLIFDLEMLKLATDNFSDSNKLGEGGFGGVFKGLLEDGQEIAVKRLSRNSGQGLGQLRNEVDLVAKLQHRNLVRLLGCCLEDQEMLLVYEYLPNTSLDRFLFDPQKSTLLRWDMRVKMIEGIARGLLYLHEDSRLKVIHRDMKASNVLLDENMNPKIADFGLARLLGEGQTLENTNRIAGTYGYMAPEYVFHGQISRKIDVYSFGVLLLEIVTGRKCVGNHGTTGAPAGGLLGYVWKHWEDGDAQIVVDPNAGDYQIEEVRKCIHIGLLCVQQEPTKRPSMSSVVHMLIGDAEMLPTLDVNPVMFAYLTYDHSTTTTSTTADVLPRCAPPANGNDDTTMPLARYLFDEDIGQMQTRDVNRS